MKYTLQNLFQDSELKVEFNSKLKKEKFNSFNKMLKAFRLHMNANQNLIMSSLVDKSLNSKDGVFLYLKTYEAVALGVSRSTIERFFKQLQDLQILVKVAEKEIQDNTEYKDFTFKVFAYAINADILDIFLNANLKFNKYYKSIFGEKIKKVKGENTRILALEDEVKIRDEKIQELEKMVTELKKGEGVYDTKDVEGLENQNTELRNKLQEMVEAYERLGEKYKDLAEKHQKLESADNEATAVLVAENQQLKKLVEESKSIQNVTESEEYKNLLGSNQLLESTATRLTEENEELRKKLESKDLGSSESESEKDKKIQELESRLKKAEEYFKEQKQKIKDLQSQNGVNIDEIRAEIDKEIRDKANATLREYDAKVKERMREQENKIQELINEREDFVKSITGLKELEIRQLKSKITELESNGLSKINAKGVPFSLMDFVEKAIPMCNNHLNPTQREVVKGIFLRMAKDLTECYAQDYKEMNQMDEDLAAEAEAVFPEPTNYVEAKPVIKADINDKGNLTAPVFEQEDLPF